MRKTFFCLMIAMVSSILWQGCDYETIPGPVNCEENPVVLELVSVEDSNCELKDGRIEVQASGGSGNYRFSLGNNDQQSVAVFEEQPAGSYEISVFDENNCTATISAIVKNKDGLNITFETTDAGCNASNGSITISPFDGTAPYQFKIGDGGFATNNTFTGLSPGSYTMVVSDASGCEVIQAIKVPSGISFSTSISKIIENQCAISSCHNGTQFPDFRIFKNIHDNASQIKALTGDRTMPQEGTLTQAEINMIACWVDDGAGNN